ncbi:putative LRR receptor-like serine/threonine-protein kinase [Zea mays]|uniref:Putative LRR receptor-like serine/threonine-protein kinase n=1 Tax=Zea mays TaxID=4577 RepID=A0A1D6MWY3_MAIZE|nr:putative LRR receptor-like serine/threonine-protein kinase [Zea mays]
MYQEATATQSLFLLSMSRPSARFYFNRYQFKPDNSFPPFRYPDDSYDRLWQRYGRNAAWTTMNTTKEVDVSNVTGSFDKPSEILQNAATPVANGANRMDFSWSSDPSLEQDANADGNATTYLLILYFAELQRVPSDGLRQFDILINNATGNDGSSQGFTPRYLSAAAVKRTVQGPGQHNVSLVATPAATLPPILNAFEIYAVKPMTEMPTDDENWKGDPCAPRAFAWDGLNCTYPPSIPAQITALNLSSSRLTGAINSSFGDLKSLQRLDLSKNSLSGPVPGFLAQMPSLLFLDLSSNKLSGPVPAALLEKVQNGSLVLRMDNNANLCDNGPSTCDQEKKRNRTLIIATVVPIVVAALLFVAGLLILRRMRNRQDTWMPNNSRFTSPQASSHIFENRKFTYKELKLMTANFREEIGRGGFGAVFLGYLENGNPVAVKMRSKTSSQGDKEFLAEVQHLTRVHHKNLVSLIGYCKDKKHLALVYEYMQGGSLEDCLRGLEYLHKSCQPPLIHRDVKTKNILLSADLEAKIADFGLMKAFADEFRTHVTTQPAGTLGYLDPEYYNTSQLSEKSDVYSFGVVLLELVTGQPPAVPVSDAESVHVALWVRRRLSEGDIASVADPRMGGAYDVNSVWKVAELGLRCKEQPSRERPAMTDIVAELRESLQLEVSYAMGYYSSSVSTSAIDLSTASAGLQSDEKPSDRLGQKAALELQQQHVDSESSATVGPAPR